MTAIATAGIDGRLAAIEAQLAVLVADAERRRDDAAVVRDLVAELSLIAGPAMATTGERLEELDRRGYFAFARGGAGVLDRIVTSFDADDVEALGDNVVLILETIRDMTQPEVLGLLRRTAGVASPADGAEGPPPSTLALMRRLRDPDVRRGLARLLDLLGSVGTASEGDRALGEPTTRTIDDERR